MKSGSPILSTNLQPMPEFCGDSAEYFDGKNIDELTIKIEELLKNDNKRKGIFKNQKNKQKNLLGKLLLKR